MWKEHLVKQVKRVVSARAYAGSEHDCECMKSMSPLCVCRLHGAVMDGQWVPADVLFFYKTLPLCSRAQGRVCHACDE